MLFSDFEKITGGFLQSTGDWKVSGFSVDSRSLTGRDDEVFIAIKGPNRDGHDFIQSAWDNGIRNFIVEREVPGIEADFLIVDNSVDALQKIAADHRSRFKSEVIGITGSNGKTTIKEWLSVLLSKKFFIVKSPKSFNSQIGVPLSVLEMNSRHEVGVFEAGISQPGEMIRLEKIIQPTLGIFTSLGVAHEDGFNSEIEKLEEKLNLFLHCEKIVCRKDVHWFSHLARCINEKNLITWSLEGQSKFHVRWTKGKITIDEIEYYTKLSHPAELENITHSIVAAIELGLSRQEIQAGLELIRAVEMRLELKKGINGCYLLDDTYNNDLVGLKTAMNYLDAHRQNQKKTLILSDILHSAQDDHSLYVEVAELIAHKNFDRLIAVGNRISNAKEVFKKNSLFFSSTVELLENMPAFNNEMVLIKGARDYRLERVVTMLEEKTHGTVLEINFESLRHNLNQYRNLLDSTTRLMVMVKANAYGSGILEVANFLQHENVDYLGVAYVDEAILLRNNGIDLPIMIMNPHISSFSQFERYDLQAEIFSFSHLKQFLSDTTTPPGIHLKIDTGMHRLGFSAQEIPELIEHLRTNQEIKVESIFTHFSSSDSPEEDEFTRSQAGTFDKVYNQLSEALGYYPIKHACNSPAMVRWPEYHYEMVRLGIGLHGFDPTNTLSLKPSGQLKSVISQIRLLKKGDTVGYSRKGKLKRNSKIAVLPIGYEDGYLRVFGNGNANVMINGHPCPTVGNICMDMTMVDVTDISAKEGNEAIIFGNTPSIHDLAKAAHTIPYEILTNVSSRVKRVFVSE
ncbi:MAG: bifunctional UDP-N-acetylmuramoyl-tripeptide:D-alanyl-D-alanine ligase/alanine racemase [Cyclobacteriaceae bacterium]